MANQNSITEGNATGNQFYLNLGVDISNAINLEIEFIKPNGDFLLKTSDISIPSYNLIDALDGTTIIALANQYLAYEWIADDVPIGSAGLWKSYPRLTINGQVIGATCSGCFTVLSRNVCC